MPLAARQQPLLGLLLRLAAQRWNSRVDAALDAAGFGDLRPAHANVFPFVPEAGASVSELAAWAQVRKQTMAQAVDQLEQLGYVERRPDPRDRRARLVRLTARGKAVRPVAVRAGRQAERCWAELTSPEHIEQLRGQLQRLLTALSEDSASAPTDP